MAFNSILRRASKSLLPLAICSVGSPRAFHRAVPAIPSVGNSNLGHNFSRLIFLPFSTATAEVPASDDKLIRVLDSEIECAEEPIDIEVMPELCPFEIEDKLGERTIILSRNYQDEVIRVEVDMPTVDEDEDDDADADADGDKNSEEPDYSSIPLIVTVSKGDGLYLEFGVTGFRDKIIIDNLVVKQPDEAVDRLAYEGPDFSDLDENLQTAFHKYLEVRGIKSSFTNFLFEYMHDKDDKEYLQWLKNLKNFVEK